MSNQNNPNARRVTSRQWQVMVSECLDQAERLALFERFKRKEIVIDDSSVKPPREQLTAYQWAQRIHSVSDAERQKLQAARDSGEIEVLEPHDPYKWADNAKRMDQARSEKEVGT